MRLNGSLEEIHLILADQDAGDLAVVVEEHGDFDGSGIAELPFVIADGFEVKSAERFLISVPDEIDAGFLFGILFRFGKDACGFRRKRLDRCRRLRSADKKCGCRENAGNQSFHGKDSFYC